VGPPNDDATAQAMKLEKSLRTASRKEDVRKPKLKRETIRELDPKSQAKNIKGGRKPVNTDSCIIKVSCGCP